MHFTFSRVNCIFGTLFRKRLNTHSYDNHFVQYVHILYAIYSIQGTPRCVLITDLYYILQKEKIPLE